MITLGVAVVLVYFVIAESAVGLLVWDRIQRQRLRNEKTQQAVRDSQEYSDLMLWERELAS